MGPIALALAGAAATLRSLRSHDGPIGRVHSVHPRCLNLSLRETGALCSLHEGPSIPSPFGIALDRAPGDLDGVGLLGGGEEVSMAAGVLAIAGGALRVDLRKAEARPLRLSPTRHWGNVSRRRQGAEFLRALLANGPAHGLAAILFGADQGPLHRRGARGARDLQAGFRDRQPRRWLGAAATLLGLGPGLTPSGDDLLVGFLAGLHGAGMARSFLAGIAPDLLALAHARTTYLSRNFLGHAVGGRFGEPILDLFRADGPAPLEGAARRLLAFGASSGADCLAGIILALESVERN